MTCHRFLRFGTLTIVTSDSRLRQLEDVLFLYTNPEEYGFNDCLVAVDRDTLNTFMESSAQPNLLPCDEVVYELAHMLMDEYRMIMPRDAYEAITLYRFLRNEITSALNT